jgi:hypothetical protein
VTCECVPAGEVCADGTPVTQRAATCVDGYFTVTAAGCLCAMVPPCSDGSSRADSQAACSDGIWDAVTCGCLTSDSLCPGTEQTIGDAEEECDSKDGIFVAYNCACVSLDDLCPDGSRTIGDAISRCDAQQGVFSSLTCDCSSSPDGPPVTTDGPVVDSASALSLVVPATLVAVALFGQ